MLLIGKCPRFLTPHFSKIIGPALVLSNEILANVLMDTVHTLTSNNNGRSITLREMGFEIWVTSPKIPFSFARDVIFSVWYRGSKNISSQKEFSQIFKVKCRGSLFFKTALSFLEYFSNLSKQRAKVLCFLQNFELIMKI